MVRSKSRTGHHSKTGFVITTSIILILIVTGYYGYTTFGTTGSSTTTTSSSSTTSPSASSQSCSTTTVTDISKVSKTTTECGSLAWLSNALSVGIGGQTIYNSTTGQSGQIRKSWTLTQTPSKPVNQTTLQLGLSAYIGNTKIASNASVIRIGGAPNSLKPISLTITGANLESYANLFQQGGTLSFVIAGNESFVFTDRSLFSGAFVGNIGNSSLTYKAQSPTVSGSTDCGGCLLNPTASAYVVPQAGATTFTLQLQGFPNEAGSSVSASYMCWDAAKLTQPCAIVPSSLGGQFNANNQFGFRVTLVTLGAISGYYLSNSGTVKCCASMYASVGYSGSVNLVSAVTGWGWVANPDGSRIWALAPISSLPIQFVIASGPVTLTGGTVYITAPCSLSLKACNA